MYYAWQIFGHRWNPPQSKLKSIIDSEKQNKTIVTYRLNIRRSAKQTFVYGGHENWFKKNYLRQFAEKLKKLSKLTHNFLNRFLLNCYRTYKEDRTKGPKIKYQFCN